MVLPDFGSYISFAFRAFEIANLRVRVADSFFFALRLSEGLSGIADRSSAWPEKNPGVVLQSIGDIGGYRLVVWEMPTSSVPYAVIPDSLPSAPLAAHAEISPAIAINAAAVARLFQIPFIL